MEHIINILVAYDKDGQEIVREAQDRRQNEISHIGEYEAEMYRNYEQRHHQRIEKYREQAEKEKADQILQAKRAFEAQMNRLREQFTQNGDRWVEELVHRCIGG